MTDPNIPVLSRQWWPEAYLDESMPAGRATPNAWLFQTNDGAHRYGEASDEIYPSFVAVEGETVTFCACDRLSMARLSIGEDGSFTFTPEPPPGATLVLAEDYDFVADSPRELVDQMKESSLAGAGEHDVHVTLWREEVELRFTALNGPPRFEAAIASAEASPIPASAAH